MRIYTVLPALLALAALPAQATTTYYCASACGANTESAFNTAMGALIFAGLTSPGTVDFTGGTSGVTVPNVGPTGVDFTGFNGANPATLNVIGSQLQHTFTTSGVGIVISLPGAIYAFGTHVIGTTSSGRTWCFEATPLVCDSGFIPVNNAATSFFGAISDVAIPTLQFRSGAGSGALYLNDFTVAETPEGATFLLVGLGLIMLPLLKRKARGPGLGAAQSPQCSP